MPLALVVDFGQHADQGLSLDHKRPLFTKPKQDVLVGCSQAFESVLKVCDDLSCQLFGERER